MHKLIPFHLPFVNNSEVKHLKNVINKNILSDRGIYTKKCEEILKKDFKRSCILTKSCTHALEIIAYMLSIKKNDEIIIPSYTFVSTANAFAIRGAKIVLVDSNKDNPCIDVNEIKKKINKNTKAICIVHYAGISCDIKKILKLCKSHKLKLIEDCAHSYGSYGYGQKLGTFGDYSTLSFHNTKNLISGEGGALILKNKKDYKKARIISEKGTNRISFLEGKAKKYTWVGFGSSYTLSELNSALLYSQLKKREVIRKKRIKIFKFYKSKLSNTSFSNFFLTPTVPKFSRVNGHIFYLICRNMKILSKLKDFALKNNIILEEHYKSLHKSPFIKKSMNLKLRNSEIYEKRLLRLPIYPSLKHDQLSKIVNTIKKFVNQSYK